jgi:hypothetical protein
LILDSRVLPLILTAGLLVGAAPGQAVAQGVGGVWDYDAHVCGDCHGAHPTNPVSTLVYLGSSVLAGQFSGLSMVSERCLQCHGVEADRQQAKSDRVVPLAGATYLGPSTSEDHKLGRADPDLPTVNCTMCHSPHRPWEVTQQTPVLDQACLQCHKASRDQGDHAVLSCGICHRLHNGPTELFRESDRDNICGACHVGAPTPLYPGISPVIGPAVHTSPQGRCRDCHKEH